MSEPTTQPTGAPTVPQHHTPPPRRTSVARRLATTSAAAAIFGALAFAGPAAAAVAWDDSEAEFSIITGCQSGEIEAGLGAYVGYLHDSATPPRPGDVFYGRTVAAVAGNSCAGHAVRFEVTPPPGVSIAISAANPVVCLTRELGGASTPIPASRCPQVTSVPLYGGAVAFDPADGGNDPTWDIVRKQVIEIQFPMVAGGPLLGPGAFPCDCLHAFTKVIDTSENPVLKPKIAVVVAGAAAGPAPAPAPAAAPASAPASAPAPAPNPAPTPKPASAGSGPAGSGPAGAGARPAGKCASSKGAKRARCIKKACGKLKGKKKRACVTKVTRKTATAKP